MKRTVSFILVFVLIFSSIMIADAASYKPAKVTGLEAVYSSTTSVKLKWNAVKKATGYKIYKYIDSQKKYVALKKTKKAEETVNGLKEGTTYKFAVRAYRKVDGTVYYGKYSDKLKLTTIKLKTQDLENLGYLLGEIDVVNWNNKKAVKYNYKTMSTTEVLEYIGGFPFYGGICMAFNLLGWDFGGIYFRYYDETDSNSGIINPDPLGTIASMNLPSDYYEMGYVNGYTGYYKIKASKFDWVLKNIYNKKPTHNNYVIESSLGWEDAYYYNGYYYFPFIATGKDYWGDLKIISKEIDSKGVYTIKFKERLHEIGYDYPLDESKVCAVKARLKKIDGKRIWSIYTIS